MFEAVSRRFDRPGKGGECMKLVAESFEQLYVEIAKLKPHDQKHVLMCLRNRKRQLQKEMATAATVAHAEPSSKDSLVI